MMSENRYARRGLCLAALVSCLLLSGCQREWYRQQADDEAHQLIQEKTYDRWSHPYRGVTMDPRSRFYDAFDPVRPPMPLDDPESHKLMHCVDGKAGWHKWHDNGELSELENPQWETELLRESRLTDDGKVFLDLKDSVRLALIHSPAYQQQLETIYLSALDVSTERFRLVTQFFGSAGGGGGGGGANRAGSTFFNQTSTDVTKTKSSLTSGTELGLRTRMATAGELVVGFANSVVWQFSGDSSTVSGSLINFSLVQPLLRGAGRNIALETLTIAERTLLANVRSFEFYRMGFYTQVAIGENNVVGPSRRGGFSGGSGLSGFSGLGTGGFGGVGDATGFGRNGNTGNANGGGAGGAGSGFAGGGAGQVGGFIGLLQQFQQIRNTETSLRAQLQTLDLLEAHLKAGLIDIAQVDQFRQSIQTERANLLQSHNTLENALEIFKTGSLGLPPDLPVSLDDSLIKQFQFLDPSLQQVQAQLQGIVRDFGDLPEDASVEQVREILARLGTLTVRINEQLELVTADVGASNALRPVREKLMEPTDKQSYGEDQLKLVATLKELREQFVELSAVQKTLSEKLTDKNLNETSKAILSLDVELTNLLSEMTLVQARARVESVTLDTVELTYEPAIQIARANRFDWMNNRAALVDTWRLIEFNANRLESNVDVFVNGNVGIGGDNLQGRFGADNSSMSAGVRFDAPFNRLVERNDFRQQLLVYQQSRRQLIQFEDTVYRSLRSLLRDLEQLRVNLEIQRRSVAIAIRRVDQTRENFSKPTPPGLPGEGQSQFGPTAAVNLLTALSDLRSSQNNFMSVWLNYYATRMRLMRELGIMRLDDNGVWVEESIDSALQANVSAEPLPPEVPTRLFDALDAAELKSTGPAKVPAAEPVFLPQPQLVEPNKLPGEAAMAKPVPPSEVPMQAPIRKAGWRATKK